MFKKIAVVLLIAMLAFGATACQKEEPKPTETPQVTESVTDAPAENADAPAENAETPAENAEENKAN